MKRRFETLEELEAYEREGREAWTTLRDEIIKALYLREITEALGKFLNRKRTAFNNIRDIREGDDPLGAYLRRSDLRRAWSNALLEYAGRQPLSTIKEAGDAKS